MGNYIRLYVSIACVNTVLVSLSVSLLLIIASVFIYCLGVGPIYVEI